MSIKYSCSHLDDPHAPLPPSYPSSSSSCHPLEKLYFCEECDAVRCDLCVVMEIASYFCPNCLFDVPSANVRADKNRCARSCFSCPTCESSLSITASDTPSEGGSTQAGPPYTLICSGCKWSSKQVGWQFEKPTGIALQLQKMNTQAELVQSEFDSLKDHLESYISLSTSAPSAPSSTRSTRNPSRHISNLTQMAQKALHRDVGSMVAYSARNKRTIAKDGEKEKLGWDELSEYEPKDSWRKVGLERGLQNIDTLRQLEESGTSGLASLDGRWARSYDHSKMANDILPQRIPLQTKLTKRCPHPNCRHLLIQPDTKSVRMKIKMVAANYLPFVEIGRRRRRIPNSEITITDSLEQLSSEDIERRRRERRRTKGGMVFREEDELLGAPLKAGETYSYQIALTNPLYDPIQIRLTTPHQPKKAPTPKFNLTIPTPHFTINAMKDAWAYDEEDEDEDFGGMIGGSETGFSEEGTAITSNTGIGTATGSGQGTFSKKSRLSILASGKNDRKNRDREGGVEKRGNISKVNLEVEILDDVKGKLEFDLEIRYTYKAEDLGTSTEKEGKANEGKTKEEYKIFTFWVRVNIGKIE
ncbi:uncharacterized protein I206_102736 [Kwoniella pini CBS 10737]|uniref:Dynactin subunit 4 n=1 Tax=Kwoniella pini CBS 10737 TaxID=1296096 RepID=A0A1B9I675_9TREE|nr:dynactin 4 [Kwoniella pini CBS 10737]OCF51026.1 dynactin 4 [Kwoniella pini CBS 10737]